MGGLKRVGTKKNAEFPMNLHHRLSTMEEVLNNQVNWMIQTDDIIQRQSSGIHYPNEGDSCVTEIEAYAWLQ